MQKNNEMYKIIYYCDEIGIKPTNCLQPWKCDCQSQTVKCGYDAEECKKKIIDHYQERVDYLKSLSKEEFLRSMGIYFD